MADQVREPIQKRSIETKKKIIEGAFVAFSESGYFSTNTAEIAKKAGVSTGIVYGYFKNKRDILLDVLDIYIDEVYSPIEKVLDKFSTDDDIFKVVDKIIEVSIKAHKNNAKIHEALHSLSHTDPLVKKRFDALEDEITKKLVNKIQNGQGEMKDIYEKVHLAMNIVQSYCHESVFDAHSYINDKVMREQVKNIIVNLFK